MLDTAQIIAKAATDPASFMRPFMIFAFIKKSSLQYGFILAMMSDTAAMAIPAKYRLINADATFITQNNNVITMLMTEMIKLRVRFLLRCSWVSFLLTASTGDSNSTRIKVTEHTSK